MSRMKKFLLASVLAVSAATSANAAKIELGSIVVTMAIPTAT